MFLAKFQLSWQNCLNCHSQDPLFFKPKSAPWTLLLENPRGTYPLKKSWVLPSPGFTLSSCYIDCYLSLFRSTINRGRLRSRSSAIALTKQEFWNGWIHILFNIVCYLQLIHPQLNSHFFFNPPSLQPTLPHINPPSKGPHKEIPPIRTPHPLIDELIVIFMEGCVVSPLF